MCVTMEYFCICATREPKNTSEWNELEFDCGNLLICLYFKSREKYCVKICDEGDCFGLNSIHMRCDTFVKFINWLKNYKNTPFWLDCALGTQNVYIRWCPNRRSYTIRCDNNRIQAKRRDLEALILSEERIVKYISDKMDMDTDVENDSSSSSSGQKRNE